MRSVGQAVRASLLAVAIATGAAAWISCDAPTAAKFSAWLHHQLTSGPDAAFRRLEGEFAAGNFHGAVEASERFFALVPLPHPADAYGAKYRHALGLQIRAAERTGNLAGRLRAGERAFAFDAHDSWLLFRFGMALSDAGQSTRAGEILRAAFVIRPTAPQILQAIERLPNVDPAAATEMRQRHYEALALCMNLPTWMSGDFVAPGSTTRAFALRLSVAHEVHVREDVANGPTGFYIVLPRVPELELKVTTARFVPPNGEAIALAIDPQGPLLPLDDGYFRIAVPADAEFDVPAVLGFAPLRTLPEAGRIEVTIHARPSEPVAAVHRLFGSLRHPGVKATISD